MNIGYIRVSTVEQNTARQEAQLGFCDRLYVEKASGKNAARPRLQEMLSSVSDGDVIWITELSRLGRSNVDLLNIAEQLRAKGVALKSLKENIDLSNAAGVLTFQIFSAMAEFERSMIRERQAEGIAQQLELVKKGERKAWGRSIKYEIPDEVFRAFSDGSISLSSVLEEYHISRSAFYKRYSKWRS